MSKILKLTTIIFLLIALFAFQASYAADSNTSDIFDDMNLTDNATTNTDGGNTTNTDNTTNTNTSNTNSTNTTNNTSGYDYPVAPSTTVSDISSGSEDGLGLSNILNILIIVIGVLLILLAIAILIRMKK